MRVEGFTRALNDTEGKIEPISHKYEIYQKLFSHFRNFNHYCAAVGIKTIKENLSISVQGISRDCLNFLHGLRIP